MSWVNVPVQTITPPEASLTHIYCFNLQPREERLFAIRAAAAFLCDHMPSFRYAYIMGEDHIDNSAHMLKEKQIKIRPFNPNHKLFESPVTIGLYIPDILIPRRGYCKTLSGTSTLDEKTANGLVRAVEWVTLTVELPPKRRKFIWLDRPLDKQRPESYPDDLDDDEL